MYSSFRQQSTHFDENAALGILQHLGQAELQDLMEDEQKLDDLINDLQQVKSIEVDKETLMASNKSLAEYNLSREPVLTQGKDQLASKYEEAVRMQKVFEEDKQQLDLIVQQTSLDTLLALLQTEAAKSEEETEETADQFLDGNIEVDAFIDQYIPKRTAAHLKKVKAEKLAELLPTLQNSQASHNQAPYPNAMGPAPTANSWGPAPYPVGAYGMPDPTAYMPR